MAAPKRSSLQRANDLAILANRYLRGIPQATIAEELGVSPAQISYDLRQIQKKWIEAAVLDFNEARVQELTKINELERTYWEAWEESKKPKIAKATTISEMKDKAKSVKTGKLKPLRVKTDTKTFKRREYRDGNPMFLQGVEWCIKRRCAILGLDAPKRTELSGPDGGPIEFIDAGDSTGLGPSVDSPKVKELPMESADFSDVKEAALKAS